MKYHLKNIVLFIAGIIAFQFSSGSIYQAETADLYKAVVEIKNSGYLGDAYINFDNEAGSYLELKIGMASAGEQTIQIRFANGGATNRPMQIKLNNSVIAESLSFNPTGSWIIWNTVDISANFTAGINTLRLTSTGSEGGPNIDQFEVSGEQLQTYSLNLSVSGNGAIAQTPEKGILFSGQKVTLIAKPGFSAIFKAWTGDFSGTNDTLKFEMNSDKSVQAVFENIDLEIPEPDFSMVGYATVSGEGLETTTGGEGGNVVIIQTLNELIAWGASREDNYTAETVIIKGKIEAAETEVITIKRGKDISIFGDSESNGGFAELKNISINIRDYTNVIVRNLKIHEVFYPNDDLTIDNCHHVWIDHCEFHSKMGPGIGVDTYDGLLDIKKGSHNVTVSWCYFHDHMKTVLIGHSDNNGPQDVNLEVTFHHNWFSNTDGRNPSLRFGKVHYFNNYLENIADYGFAVRNGAHAKIENCHFERVKLPIATDKFTGHGFACVSGCIYSGTCSESDNEISAPLDCEFWADQIPYNYNLEDVNTVSLSVNKYAGVGKIDIATSAPVLADDSKLQVSNVFFDRNNNIINILFTNDEFQKVSFSVYTIEGKKVYSSNKSYSAGNFNEVIQLDRPRNGLHLVQIETAEFRQTKKVVLF